LLAGACFAHPLTTNAMAAAAIIVRTDFIVASS
jgi:hypothetical protein